ncbi:MAG: hypothetical protein Fur0021_12520 [Candidatus Promineifilaceae bacterium]
MNFSVIWRQAWRFTWQHKPLWWLGLLASLAQAAGILLLPGWLSAGSLLSEVGLLQLLESINRAGEQWLQPGRLMAGMAATLAIAAVVWLSNLLAEGGMIAAVTGAATGQPLSLRQAAAAGRQQLKRFALIDTWLYLPALAVTLLMLITLLLLLGGLSWGLQANSAPGALAAVLVSALVCLTSLGLLLLPVLLLTTAARQLTFRAAAAQNLTAREGIRWVGWECRQNPGQTLLMVTLLLALRALLSGAARLAVAPFGLLNLLLQGGDAGSYLAINLLADLLHLGLTAICAVFMSAFWTLAYRSLSGVPTQAPEGH